MRTGPTSAWLVLFVAASATGCRTAPAHGTRGAAATAVATSRTEPPAHAEDEHAGDDDLRRTAVHEEHEEAEASPPPLGADLRCGWRDPALHSHESRLGTPYVHAFHIEPAFLGRDLLLHVEKEGEEHAVEAELEWAVTRRLLLVAEAPYVRGEDEEGVGDLGLGLRALGIETDRFLLAGQVSIELPTAQGDLGADETIISPTLIAWADLGGWFTAQASVGFEHGIDSGDQELSVAGVLAKSFPCGPLCRSCVEGRAHLHSVAEHGHDAHEHESHGHAGVLSLFLEGRATQAVAGSERGAREHELLLGVSVPVTDRLDLRVGWTLLWEHDADDPVSGWVAGFVLHL
jgi:hypothetical protein